MTNEYWEIHEEEWLDMVEYENEWLMNQDWELSNGHLWD